MRCTDPTRECWATGRCGCVFEAVPAGQRYDGEHNCKAGPAGVGSSAPGPNRTPLDSTEGDRLMPSILRPARPDDTDQRRELPGQADLFGDDL